MQNKTDKGTSLVSKSLPVVNSNSVCRLFSARNRKYYVSDNVIDIWKSPLDFFPKKPSHVETKSDFPLVLYLMNKGDIPTLPRIEEEWNHPVQIGPYP